MAFNWSTFGNAITKGQGVAAGIYSGFTGETAPWYNWLSPTNKSVDVKYGLFTGSSPSDDAGGELYVNNQEWAEEQAQKQMDFQTSANRIAMDFNAAEADKVRAWEADMANSAYQRAVKDLKAAGLNPILAYSQGGAAVPSVSAAQGVTSVGAKASTGDYGYNERNQELAEYKLLVNSALTILGVVLLGGKSKTILGFK